MNFNATFFGQLIAFAAFVGFCMKFVWPLLLGKLQEREKHIADGLAAAEQGQKKLLEAEQRLQASIAEGKVKAAEIISQAERRGVELVAEAKQQARAVGEQQLALATSEIEQEQERARQELRQQVAMLAVAGAEQILRREVNAEAHDAILSRLGGEL